MKAIIQFSFATLKSDTPFTVEHDTHETCLVHCFPNAIQTLAAHEDTMYFLAQARQP